MADFTIKRGDRVPSLTAVLRQNGTPINLTAGTVFLVTRPKNGGNLKINGTCVLVDAVNGVVRYDWGALDTNAAGTFIAEFVVVNGGKTETVPNDRHLEFLIYDSLLTP